MLAAFNDIISARIIQSFHFAVELARCVCAFIFLEKQVFFISLIHFGYP